MRKTFHQVTDVSNWPRKPHRIDSPPTRAGRADFFDLAFPDFPHKASSGAVGCLHITIPGLATQWVRERRDRAITPPLRQSLRNERKSVVDRCPGRLREESRLVRRC